MGEKKICWITDIVHGSFAISALEKRLVATTIFNRLHNVLQSSTVFYTYPSGRTSRFSHSLGAMHLAGKLFRAGLLNATEEDRNLFFDLSDQTIGAIDAQIKSEGIFSGPQTELQEYSCCALIDPFYATQILPGLGCKEAYQFILLLQAVRLAALFHDVGHPPFSHVIERALGQIFDRICPKNTRTQNEKAFFEVYDAIQVKNIAFHETLSVQLARHLLQNEIDSIGKKEKLAYDYARIKSLALGILSKNAPFYKAIHDIVASDLDADRLDYVPRDLIMSGFSKAPVRTDRLIASYQMVSTGKRVFAFMPSVRALSSIEEFFQKRFDLYKFVSYHHRVIKCDALLEQSVAVLAGQLLEDPKTPPLIEDDYFLREDISGLWQVLNPDVTTFAHKSANYYTQWDDAWLLAILRRAYFEREKKASKSKRAQDENSLLQVQLEELLSNSKSYYSLFKRGDTFQEVDHAFLHKLEPTFDWKKLKEKLPHHLKIGADRLARYHAAFKKARGSAQDPDLTAQMEENGFFLGALLVLVHGSGKGGKDGMEFVRAAVQDLKKKSLIDALLIQKKIKAGVTPDLQLVNRNGKVISLGQVSRIANELFRAVSFFPPFFIFVYVSSPPTHEQIIRLREQLGTFLARRFKEWTENS